jgi:hypothetical protein
MVDRWIQVVDAYSIDSFSWLVTGTKGTKVLRLTNSLEQSGIPQTCCPVTERVNPRLRLVACLTAWLVSCSDNLEALASNGVDEVGSLDDERGDSSRNLDG